jgi:hypothetical protein
MSGQQHAYSAGGKPPAAKSGHVAADRRGDILTWQEDRQILMVDDETRHRAADIDDIKIALLNRLRMIVLTSAICRGEHHADTRLHSPVRDLGPPVRTLRYPCTIIWQRHALIRLINWPRHTEKAYSRALQRFNPSVQKHHDMIRVAVRRPALHDDPAIC